jgi:hypothetical protein
MGHTPTVSFPWQLTLKPCHFIGEPQNLTAYGERKSVKELAQTFGIHRVTVTVLLRRHGVQLRRAGLAAEAAHAVRTGVVVCPAGRKVWR